MPHAQMISIADEQTRKMIIGHKVVAWFPKNDGTTHTESKEGVIVEAHQSHCLAIFEEEKIKVGWGQVTRVFYR
jgi:glutaredoxin 2